LHEILNYLPASARVLDLGCKEGSFSATGYRFTVVRADLDPPRATTGLLVQADAVHLPFPSHSFDAVIMNHSLEHFVELKAALQEIGRLIKPGGAAYVAIPDASTLTDRVYRTVFREAGGHVNLFKSASEVEWMLSWYFGLPHVATRTLFSSFAFINRENTRAVRSDMRFAGFSQPILGLLTGCTRLIDRWFGTRTSVYGWAFYLGHIEEPVTAGNWPNVCIRCGQARPAGEAARAAQTRRLLRLYRCEGCGTRNFLFPDPAE